jgi:hypothetical protein
MVHMMNHILMSHFPISLNSPIQVLSLYWVMSNILHNKRTSKYSLFTTKKVLCNSFISIIISCESFTWITYRNKLYILCVLLENCKHVYVYFLSFYHLNPMHALTSILITYIISIRQKSVIIFSYANVAL